MKQTAAEVAIEWCGVCWIDGERTLSIGREKIGKGKYFPICRQHYFELRHEKVKLAELFSVWDAMPEFDTGENSMVHFNNLLKGACFTGK